MSLLIPGTNSIKDTTYDVANSLRFNPGSSDTLTRTFGTPTNNKKFTISFWIKKCESGREQHIFSASSSAQFYFNSSDQLYFYDQTAGNAIYKTTQLFRDSSAWMHIVVAVDTTLASAGDRLRIYVNGSEITDFATETHPTQDNASAYNTASAHTIGTYPVSPSGYYLSAYLTEFVFIDGQQLDPTSFGEFDEDSPTIWKPKDVSSLTFGNNGFHLDFEDSSSLGNDAAGSNNFTVNNLTAIDQCTDTCTNNFATFTSENHTASNWTLSEGNLKCRRTTGTSGLHGSSIMPTDSGKWYFEVKIGEAGQGDRSRVGIMNYQTQLNNSSYSGVINTPSQVLAGCTTSCKTGKHFVGTPGSVTEYTASGDFSDGDIVQFAMDLDNKAIYIGRNGTYLTLTGSSGGDPTSGSSKTGAITTSTTIMDGSPMTAYTGLSVGSGSDTSEMFFNFGNPPFSISSGNTDGNGFGNFEYAPPTGYLAWCSKNLAESG
jgi:hypothetical protein